MGRNVVYLIPRETGLSSAHYAASAKAFLLDTGIISEYADSNFFGNGQQSSDAFDRTDDDITYNVEYPFDSVDIYGGPFFKIAPDEYVSGIACPACGEDVTEQWSNAVYGEEGEGPARDLLGVQIACDACKYCFDLAAGVRDDDELFYLSDRWVCFMDASRPTESWIHRFDSALGCKHDVMEYWST